MRNTALSNNIWMARGTKMKALFLKQESRHPPPGGSVATTTVGRHENEILDSAHLPVKSHVDQVHSLEASSRGPDTTEASGLLRRPERAHKYTATDECMLPGLRAENFLHHYPEAINAATMSRKQAIQLHEHPKTIVLLRDRFTVCD